MISVSERWEGVTKTDIPMLPVTKGDRQPSEQQSGLLKMPLVIVAL